MGEGIYGVQICNMPKANNGNIYLYGCQFVVQQAVFLSLLQVLVVLLLASIHLYMYYTMSLWSQSVFSHD